MSLRPIPQACEPCQHGWMMEDWTSLDGMTHEPSQPECLPPDSRGAVAELSVLPEVEGVYPNEVVWVRCIALPTGFRLGEGVAPLSLDDAYQQALDREG